jgi:hypothetical protein
MADGSHSYPNPFYPSSASSSSSIYFDQSIPIVLDLTFSKVNLGQYGASSSFLNKITYKLCELKLYLEF